MHLEFFFWSSRIINIRLYYYGWSISRFLHKRSNLLIHLFNHFKDFIIRTDLESDEKSIEPFEKECNPRYGILSFITEDEFKAEYRKHTEAMLEDMLNAKYL